MAGKRILLISLALLSLGSVAKTQPYIIIDDFESYTSTPELRSVWEAWHTPPPELWPAEVILEGEIVHGGLQSMKFRYDQSYGEPVIRRTYSTPQNWTEGGRSALWLWFYGDANNAGIVATGMYVELGDDDNSDGTVDDKAKMSYGDPRTLSSSPYGDANDLWRKTYYEWGIALQDFNDDNNVNPDKIKTIAFGVYGGSTGQIYYDDIRLYVPRCIPEYTRQFGNIVDPEEDIDCFVDYWDLGLMGDEWLTSGIKADIVDDDNVNFVDFAILANNWLRMVLWPP
ncbi:MAG: hypothetical protein ACYS0I_07630 [Planctomycetota bacterium]